MRTRTPRTALLTLVLVAFALPAAAQAPAQTRAMVPEDFYRLVSVGDPVISPTGDRVAFTVTEIDEEENERRRSVWLQPLSDGRPDGEPVPFTAPDQDSHSPRWSPDGSLLSFTSRRGEDRNQVWFIRSGPPGGEAFRIDGVDAAPDWSPDGRWIAFTRDPEGEEREERRRAGWVSPDAITPTLDTARFDGRVITHLNIRRDGASNPLAHPSASGKDQIFVVPAGGGEPRQLTSMESRVRGAEWSPDGRLLVFAADPHEDDEFHFEPSVELYVVAREGGEPRRVTSGPGAKTSPAFSPDGRRLAFLFVPEESAQTQLMVVDVGPDGAFAGEPRNLTGDWDLTPGSPTWTADGRAIRFDALIRGDRHLFEVSSDGGGVRQVTTGERRLSDFSYSSDGRWMAFAGTDPLRPAEVFVARADGSSEVRATGMNDGLLAELRLASPEQVLWTVSDGTEIEGWILGPPGLAGGERAPMILSIHGGPHSAYGSNFSHMFQMLAGHGFFVFYTNPRGSTGYGHDFTYSIDGGWGLIDEEDQLTGIDAVLERYPQVDPARIGVTGGSYGGFMTNWLTGRSDRFAAAVTRASVSNWEVDYGTTDSWRSLDREFLGPPWEQRELYRTLSPTSYVENVTAPTLIVHGMEDVRTPLNHAEQWYMALRRREVPVELVLYPRTPHGIREPLFAVDNMERTLRWFEHWLLEAPPAAASDDGDRGGR